MKAAFDRPQRDDGAVGPGCSKVMACWPGGHGMAHAWRRNMAVADEVCGCRARRSQRV
ncbi:MAG: hypothetical protein R3E31_06065 [Chloroflexota bacterium]